MNKKQWYVKSSIALGLGLFIINNAFADEFIFNNPDGMYIHVEDDAGNKLYHSPAYMAKFDWQPSSENVIVTAISEGSEVFRKIFSTSKLSDMNCHYSLLISSQDGYKHDKSSLSAQACTKDEDMYFPDSSVPKYSFDNLSGLHVYPAFSQQDSEFEMDNTMGYLEPGSVKTYTPADVYWSSPHRDIEEGTMLSVGFYNPYNSSYVVCEEQESAIGAKTFMINHDGTCSVKNQVEGCANEWQSSKFYKTNDRVAYDGSVWEARFYNIGVAPSHSRINLWRYLGVLNCE